MGLCGCITEEMPAAKKGIISLPAPCSPVAARYASGGIWPYTTDTFTPAFSNTSPPCRTREMPPPPPGRVQASSWNFWPSSSSIAPQISSCAARIIFSKRARMESASSSPPSRRSVRGASSMEISCSMPTALTFALRAACAATRGARALLEALVERRTYAARGPGEGRARQRKARGNSGRAGFARKRRGRENSRYGIGYRVSIFDARGCARAAPRSVPARVSRPPWS